MVARRKPERKADVLRAMADYLIDSGVSDVTLRPAATALGTSPRMLLYHFGSKEELVAAALKEVRRREIEMLGRALRRRPPSSVAGVMRSIWRWYASPRRAPYLRLFFEAWGVGLQRPERYAGFLDEVRKDMLPIAEEPLVRLGASQREARAIATFMIAALRGLLIDLAANRDRRRLGDAMEVFIEVTERLHASRRLQWKPRATRKPAEARATRERAPRRSVAGATGRRSTR